MRKYIIKNRVYWTKEKCQENALKCNTRKDFYKKYLGSYNAAHRNNWLDELCSHMESIKNVVYWTKEKCQEVSFKCENRNQFKKKYRSAYNSAYKNNWLDEICAHMLYESHVSNYYWTKEKCQEIALKCNTRKEFCKKYRSAYDGALRNNWMNDICPHMKICGTLHSRLVYLFEFSDNSVYVGLTYNYNKRYEDHLTTDISSSVYKHIKETGISPDCQKLTEYIDIKKAIELEIYYIRYYKDLGYNVLNKTNGGEYGGGYFKCNYDICKEYAEKYTLKEFRKNKRYAYDKSRKEGWLSDFYGINWKTKNKINILL